MILDLEGHELAVALARHEPEVLAEECDLNHSIVDPPNVQVHPFALVVELGRERSDVGLCRCDLDLVALLLFGLLGIYDDTTDTLRFGLGLNCHHRHRRGSVSEAIDAYAQPESQGDAGDCQADHLAGRQLLRLGSLTIHLCLPPP